MRVRYVGSANVDGTRGGKTSLTIGGEYVVLAMLANALSDHRLLIMGDDNDEPEWLAAGDFDLVSDAVPSTWRVRLGGAIGKVGYVLIAPESWLRPGFFDDYWGDGDVATVAAHSAFEHELRVILRES